MLAAVLHGKEDLRLERVNVPVACAGEIVIRVAAALTCGTDLKVFRRGYHARMLQPPALFGHEVAGFVAQVGEGVSRFKVGDRVVPLNSAPCDHCFFCTRGQQNLCEDLLFNNGAYAEFLRVPARIVEKNTLLVPEDVPLEHAALTEPLACVLRGLEESGAKAGDTMIVVGAGPIGLMFLHAAALAEVHVIAVVKHEEQAAAARMLGTDQVILLRETNEEGNDRSRPSTLADLTAPATDIVEAARSLTPECRGADVVIEAVATPATWQYAVGMVRKGGVVNFFGGPAAGSVVELDTNRLHYGDITLKASFHHTPETCRSAFHLIASKRFRAGDFITSRASLEQVGQVLTRMTGPAQRTQKREIKVAILPGPQSEGLDLLSLDEASR